MPQEAKYRICIINKNIPDMISSVAAKLSAEGINIENMVSKGRGDYAYTILETNDEISLELLERMRQREGIVRVRIIVEKSTDFSEYLPIFPLLLTILSRHYIKEERSKY